jgi:ribose-phosphate pyrophosphokinase
MITIGNRQVPTTLFPDNTSQVWHLPDEIFTLPVIHIVWTFSLESEFLQLAQLKTLLDAKGIKATLELPYLPYGRQDKEVSNESTFALRTFARQLNTLAFECVTIHDPHSRTALELIDRSVAAYPKEEIYRVFSETADLICYPDAGARTKYSEVYPGLPFIYGEKVRDQKSGQISDYRLAGDPSGKKILIIDDICDGGATFILLTKELLNKGALSVSLFVSHGLFSRGTRPLFASGISRVFTEKGELFPRHRSGSV